MIFQHFPQPCHKTKGIHPRIIIWTNLVDLEFQMLYTKIQPQSFLGSGEEDQEPICSLINIILIFCHSLLIN